MNLTPKQIEADKRLCEKATKCEWDHGYFGRQTVAVKQEFDRGSTTVIARCEGDNAFNNGDFINRFNPVTALEYITALAEKDARIAKLEARLASATKALGDITLDRIPDAVKESLARGNLNYCVTAKDIARAALKEIGGE